MRFARLPIQSASVAVARNSVAAAIERDIGVALNDALDPRCGPRTYRLLELGWSITARGVEVRTLHDDGHQLIGGRVVIASRSHVDALHEEYAIRSTSFDDAWSADRTVLRIFAEEPDVRRPCRSTTSGSAVLVERPAACAAIQHCGVRTSVAGDLPSLLAIVRGGFGIARDTLGRAAGAGDLHDRPEQKSQPLFCHDLATVQAIVVPASLPGEQLENRAARSAKLCHSSAKCDKDLQIRQAVVLRARDLLEGGPKMASIQLQDITKAYGRSACSKR